MLGILLAATLGLSIQDAGPFSPSLSALGNGAIALDVQIPAGHALYADRTKVTSSSGEVHVATQPILKHDPVMGEELLWRHEARWVIEGATPGATVEITVQGCNEIEQICYPPKKVSLKAP